MWNLCKLLNMRLLICKGSYETNFNLHSRHTNPVAVLPDVHRQPIGGFLRNNIHACRGQKSKLFTESEAFLESLAQREFQNYINNQIKIERNNYEQFVLFRKVYDYCDMWNCRPYDWRITNV